MNWKSCVEHLSGFGCVCLGKGTAEGQISKIEIESFIISREVWGRYIQETKKGVEKRGSERI